MDKEPSFSDWKLCFSKSRQREYYFNSQTGESLWTKEEVKEKIKKQLRNRNESVSKSEAVLKAKPDKIKLSPKADSNSNLFFTVNKKYEYKFMRCEA